jgi:ABC-2 type transport system ATP-binding protein
MYAIEINNLVKTYNNGVKAIQGISLNVKQGDFFALLGPNGAGKSTTIGIMSSLVNKNSGSIKIFGYDVDKDVVIAKEHMGIVPQEINFSQFEKVIDIVVNQAGFYGVPRTEAMRRAQVYLSQLNLWDKRNSSSRALSGGMKRRLMIARALMHEPKVLILDEPTAGVDIELRRSTWKFLVDLNRNKGTTIILTTHYLEEAEQLCNAIAIIDNGQIVKNTTMKNLLSQLDTNTIIVETKETIFELGSTLVEKYDAMKIDSNTIELTYSNSLLINEIFQDLTAHNINVLSFRNKANRLEELFLQLVHKNTQG